MTAAAAGHVCSSAYPTARVLPADLPHAWACSNAASPVWERNAARTASLGGTRGTKACSQPLPRVSRIERAARTGDGPLRVVLLPGDGRQDLKVVGGAGLVADLGRQRQPFLQVS